MRRWFAFFLFLSVAIRINAQDQEQKLVDRLLKPRADLQNSAQNKKFIADGASIDKHAMVAAFYVPDKPKAKPFSGTRDFSSREFSSRSFYAGRDTSQFPTNAANNSPRTFATSTSKPASTLHDGEKIADTRDFSGSRPFLDRGKSQKSLDRKNPPMTIEQVRELLNKNK